MKILVFDLFGKFACFRKIYTNTSTRSYLYPPRTTISGIIAAILGMDFDSYYTKFNLENSIIGISIISKNRTIVQNINYIKIKTESDILNLDTKGYKYTQIPTEIIIPENFSKNIHFRIFFHSNDGNVMEELKRKLIDNNPYYPISLGFANMLGYSKFIDEGEYCKTESHDFIPISSPVSLDSIENIHLNGEIMKDILPLFFDEKRIPHTKEYIFERNGHTMEVKTNKKIIKVSYKIDGHEYVDNLILPEVSE